MNFPRILVVDDDPSIRNLVQVNLKARGYKVLEVADGEEAIRIAEKEKLDLVILDIIMPKMDGFAVCRKLREWSTVPIIMLTAWEGGNDKDQWVACGANDCLTKPFVLRELLDMTKIMLKQKQCYKIY